MLKGPAADGYEWGMFQPQAEAIFPARARMKLDFPLALSEKALLAIWRECSYCPC